MKPIIFLLFMFFMVTSVFSQDRISVALNGKYTFIETYLANKESDFSINPEKKITVQTKVTGFYLLSGYRLDASASTKLKAGIKKAIEWVKLNEEHKKSFEKEICRFLVLDKSSYNTTEPTRTSEFDRMMSEEMALSFIGLSDGTFIVTLKVLKFGSSNFIELTNFEMLEKFQSLLAGKSANADVDEIFK